MVDFQQRDLDYIKELVKRHMEKYGVSAAFMGRVLAGDTIVSNRGQTSRTESFLREKREPSVEELQNLADYFNCDITDLLRPVSKYMFYGDNAKQITVNGDNAVVIASEED